MEFKNTIQALQKLGNNVVKEGRNILKQKKKNASGTLSNDFDYLVTNQQDSVTLEFEFGRAEDYWQFVDEGVKGVGGFKGSGRARGQGSDFRFGSGKFAGTWNKFKKNIKGWIRTKGLKGRDAKGKFITNDSFAFLIQRSIFQRGLERTQFFSKPFTEQLNKQTDNITEAFADDLEIALEQI
tara:strand:+ start:640 stop:1185 length:546 start_codon:yes stop_codon:yes gene_type:complete